jgi:hypothetical protein
MIRVKVNFKFINQLMKSVLRRVLLVLLKIEIKVYYFLVSVKQIRIRNQFKPKKDPLVKQPQNQTFLMVIKEVS